MFIFQETSLGYHCSCTSDTGISISRLGYQVESLVSQVCEVSCLVRKRFYRLPVYMKDGGFPNRMESECQLRPCLIASFRDFPVFLLFIPGLLLDQVPFAGIFAMSRNLSQCYLFILH